MLYVGLGSLSLYVLEHSFAKNKLLQISAM
jgi:hypothetical protein